ncbi:MAG TPA: tetratricopeptide repeat protein [Gemmatimonadaceae bacterium]|jgi:tetratricopeptide (TPR) repeat protein
MIGRSVVGVSLAFLAGATALEAQLSPDQRATIRADGDSAIAHRDWKRLVALYEPMTRTDPDSGIAWIRLGSGLHELGRYGEAAPAYRQALRLNFQPAPSELRLARVLARTKQLDSAMFHLDRAATAGIAVEQMTGEPDLRPLQNDPRYKALIARLEDTRYPCRKAPETHQLDFWVGDWVVTGWTGPSVTLGRRAENHIQPELEHCVIRERWTSATGGKGESMNFWDPNRRAWRQIWMDEGQWSLDYEGEYKDGAMRFHGWTLGPNGARRLEKLTFFNLAPDTVRQLFEQSTDSGKTWRTTFDGRYVRLKSGAH